MKAQTLLAALAACTLACAPVMAQKDTTKPARPSKPGEKAPAGQPPMSPSEEAAMKAMMEAGTPGEGQKNLEALVGEWDAVVRFRMAPEAPWSESKGVESNKMIFEGRYLHSSFNGDMEGQPFHGASIFAYNNTTKTYESTWIDSMSTGIMFMTGSYDAAKKSWTLRGESADPTQGGKKKSTRMVDTMQGPDKHTTEFFEPGMDGKEFKTMEITYTRKAGGSDAQPAKHDDGKKTTK